MKKKEIIIFSILLLAAIVSIFMIRYSANQDEKTVLITVNGNEYLTIILTDELDMEFPIETGYGLNNLVIKDGEVNVIFADCPNQVCVNTKAASHIGDIIVCLPHKVVIEIVGED